jgi:hypothetical protein
MHAGTNALSCCGCTIAYSKQVFLNTTATLFAKGSRTLILGAQDESRRDLGWLFSPVAAQASDTTPVKGNSCLRVDGLLGEYRVTQETWSIVPFVIQVEIPLGLPIIGQASSNDQVKYRPLVRPGQAALVSQHPDYSGQVCWPLNTTRRLICTSIHRTKDDCGVVILHRSVFPNAEHCVTDLGDDMTSFRTGETSMTSQLLGMECSE